MRRKWMIATTFPLYNEFVEKALLNIFLVQYAFWKIFPLYATCFKQCHTILYIILHFYQGERSLAVLWACKWTSDTCHSQQMRMKINYELLWKSCRCQCCFRTIIEKDLYCHFCPKSLALSVSLLILNQRRNLFFTPLATAEHMPVL